MKRWKCALWILLITVFLYGCSADNALTEDWEKTEGNGEEVTIRFAWWGNQDRAEKTIEAVRLFEEKNPGIHVKTSCFDFNSYGENMRIAADTGNLPDVFQGYVGADNAYMEKNMVECLEPYIENGMIYIGDISEQLIGTGMLDGRIYGLSLGCNVKCLAVDVEAYKAAGISVPEEGYVSWDALKEDLEALKQVTGKYGSDDLFDIGFMLRYYVRQHGESFYSDQPGQIGFSEETYESFYRLRKSWIQEGLIPPYKESMAGESLADSPLVRGEGAVRPCYSNQLLELSELSGKQLKLLLLPGPNTELGMDIRSGSHICMSSGSRQKEAAAKLIDFMINDVDANRILNAERGIPASEKVREEIAADFDDVHQEMLNIVNLAEKHSSPADPVAAWDTYVFDEFMTEVEEEIMFGQISEEEAYEKIVNYDSTSDAENLQGRADTDRDAVYEGSEGEGRVTLEIYAWQDESDNVKALAAGYMAQNENVVIHTNFIPVSEYVQKMMSLKNDEKGADCIFFPTPAEGSVWQNKKILKRLDEWMEETPEQDYGSWYQEGEEECRFYMIPYRMSRWAVYYNKDLFDRRGVPYPEENWTWEDYAQIAVQLTKHAGENKCYGSLSFEPTNIWWRIPARTRGAVDPMKAEDLEAFRQAAQWCYELTYELKAQLPYTEQIGRAGNSYDANFLQGDIGMFFSGDWSVASLNKMIEQENLDIHYDIAPMPHWEGEEGQVISDAAVVTMVDATRYPEETWDFIRFVTGEEGARILAQRGIIPAYCPEQIRQMYLSSENYPEHREYFFTGGEISCTPANGRYVEAMEIVKEEVAHYLLQEQDLEQTFEIVEEELEQIQP